jgi:ATP-dependent DNA helicase Q1
MVFTQQTGLQNLYSTVEYCLDAYRCRRAIIASHFDEAWENQDCNAMCDHCSKPKERKEMVITSFCQVLYQLISNAARNDKKLTAQKLLDAWYGKGVGTFRVKSVAVPKFSREKGEAILAHLLINGYLQEDFHFTPYTTISYLKRGPKAAAAMSDEHNMIMYISGRSLPTLEQSHKTAREISLTSNSKTSAPSPKMDTLRKTVQMSGSLKTVCAAKTEVVDLTLDSDVQVSRIVGGKSPSKRKAIVLDSDSDD